MNRCILLLSSLKQFFMLNFVVAELCLKILNVFLVYSHIELVFLRGFLVVIGYIIVKVVCLHVDGWRFQSLK